MGGAGGDDQPPPPPPDPASSPRPGRGPRRGFREQFGATKQAAYRLAAAHIELARAEMAEILDEVKQVAALVGVAIAVVLFATILVTVGSSLFLGEWLFGSMGWGILLFTELSVAIALISILIALDVPAAHLGRGLIIATIVGVVVGLLAGFWVFNRLWEAIGVAVAPNLDPATRPLAVGTAVGAGLGAIIGVVGGTQTRGRSIGGIIGSAIVALILGAIAGAALGAFSAITFGWPVAVGLGIAILLGTWIGLCALEAARGSIDMEAWPRKFYPSQTIETAKETMEWLRERTPLGPKS
jgi:MFS family permease